VEEKDLRALIENGLKGLADQIDASRAEARQHFEHLEGKLQQTRVQLEGQIHETRTHLEGEIRELDGKIRQTQIELESVRGDIRQLAEGIANVDEKLDRHIGETKQQFDDVRALIHLTYIPLEHRVSVLENR
jgi:chromosome segregation ATPase